MAHIHIPELEEAPEAARRVLEQAAELAARNWGIRRPGLVWRAQAHFPEYLEASWNRSKVIYQLDGFPQLTRDATHVAVSICNACHY
jgi:hypothetical protein